MVPKNLQQDLALLPHPLVSASPRGDSGVFPKLVLPGCHFPVLPQQHLHYPLPLGLQCVETETNAPPLVSPGSLRNWPGKLLRPFHSVPAGPHTPTPAGCTDPVCQRHPCLPFTLQAPAVFLSSFILVSGLRAHI